MALARHLFRADPYGLCEACYAPYGDRHHVKALTPLRWWAQRLGMPFATFLLAAVGMVLGGLALIALTKAGQ